MLPSTSLSDSAPTMFCMSHPTQSLCTLRGRRRRRTHATLTAGRPLRLTRAGLSPARRRQLTGAPAKPSTSPRDIPSKRSQRWSRGQRFLRLAASADAVPGNRRAGGGETVDLGEKDRDLGGEGPHSRWSHEFHCGPICDERRKRSSKSSLFVLAPFQSCRPYRRPAGLHGDVAARHRR
jgi:hypothetical protein